MTQRFSFLWNHRSWILSSGMQITTGISLSEQTCAKARAVLPADWTTSTRSSFLSMRAHTLKASVSLKEQVSILAPILGFQPEKVIYKLFSPRNLANPFDLYVTGAQEFLSVRRTGIHSA